jgi:hypothetical protein
MRSETWPRWLAAWLLAGFLFWGIDTACAQSTPADGSQKKDGQSSRKDAQSQPRGRSGSSTSGQAQTQTKGKAQAKDAARTPPREFSEAYRESLRRTVEKRRELRARRRSGAEASQPPGAIVPWPMPPALIIRHTPEVHGEVGNFLDILRR